MVPPALITVADDNLDKIGYAFGEILVRIREGSDTEFFSYLQGLWKEQGLTEPLRFSFVDDDMRAFYTEELNWSKIIAGAALCAILIASIGALGLISLAVTRRRKEIAIRRVMGALPSTIARGIVSHYAVPGFVAVVLALPVSYFFMNEWLSSFVYRIHLGVGTALITIFFGILLPLVGGFVHSVRVASESPTVALRED